VTPQLNFEWDLQKAHRATGLFVVVHTFVETGPDEAAVRIISVRHATKRERQVYEDGP
jgi:uncharacterized DUF497 family protein